MAIIVTPNNVLQSVLPVSIWLCCFFSPLWLKTLQQLSKIFNFSLRGRQRDMEKSRLINPKTVDRSETRQTHRYMCTRRNTHPQHIFPDIRYTYFTFVPTSVRIISISYFSYLPFCFSADKSSASFTLLSQHCSLSFTVSISIFFTFSEIAVVAAGDQQNSCFFYSDLI